MRNCLEVRLGTNWPLFLSWTVTGICTSGTVMEYLNCGFCSCGGGGGGGVGAVGAFLGMMTGPCFCCWGGPWAIAAAESAEKRRRRRGKLKRQHCMKVGSG